ncbi:hypothetical protein EVAR_40106_1 [Eumeta japonica]|uniref:Uncharacterized protein n=1 Tax=Eumeta variegata TaxID=151549 RepID=A0A4C1W9J2_EUMVA|nr:hypothetical protein EVAR_40106_1 [Eumeta japonica]
MERPPTADGSRSGASDSGASYVTARNRCQKIAYLSRRYGFQSSTAPSLQSTIERSMRVGISEVKLCAFIDI